MSRKSSRAHPPDTSLSVEDNPSRTFSIEEQQAIQNALRRLGLKPHPVPVRLKSFLNLEGRHHTKAAFSSLSVLELAQQGSLVLNRRGKTVWRIPGKGGADLPDSPLEMENKRQLKKHKAGVTKAIRVLQLLPPALASKHGVAARQKKAARVRAEVLRLNEQYARRGRAKVSLIAKALRITPRRVRQILASLDR